jgi:hypothetical protein
MTSHRSNGLAWSKLDIQIAFVLEHPGMSDWLKETLRGALLRDPLATLNDLEILTDLLRRSCLSKCQDR